MKTPMTPKRWWEEIGLKEYCSPEIGTKEIALLAFAAGQANAPQPTWRRWEDEKPSVENEWGAKSVLVEVINADDVSDQLSVCLIETFLSDRHWSGWTRIAWQYPLPSGFSPKQKDGAEVAWEQRPGSLQNISLSEFEYIFNLGRAKAKQ